MTAVPRELYPFDGHTLELAGLRLHYLDEGEGEPIVAVHGNPSWSFYYRDLVRNLRDSHRIVVPDHIGCGLSDTPGDDRYQYTLRRRIEDFSTLMDHLELDGVTLVVHDWGGPIGLGWAVRHPERVARLVILNTAAFHMPADLSLPWQLWLVRNTPVGTLLVRGANAFARGAAWVGCRRRRLPKALRDAYCAPYDSWANRIATLRFVQDIPLNPGDAAFDALTAVQAGLYRFRDRPVLICWGARDFVFSDRFLAEWRKIYPHAEVHRFADAGHYIMEDASKEVIALIRGFLGPPANPQSTR